MSLPSASLITISCGELGRRERVVHAPTLLGSLDCVQHVGRNDEPGVVDPFQGLMARLIF